jgi:hypothetical protein
LVRTSVSLLHRQLVPQLLDDYETTDSYCDGLLGEAFLVQVRSETAENAFWTHRISWYMMDGFHWGQLSLHNLVAFS